MATTRAQSMAVAIAPKFTAFLSIIGSSATAYLILTEGRKKPSSVATGGGNKPKRQSYRRLVLGMSICDLSASSAWFFTTWPIPRDTPGVYGAYGNQATCSAQAFFAQFSLSTVMYNASLALYYYLVIAKGWSDERVARIEIFLHVVSLAWGAGTAIASIPLTLFNQVGWDCWISSHPLGCEESWRSETGETTCTRGDNGSLYQWAFYYAPLWFVIAAVSLMMFLTYHAVHLQEMKMKKYLPSKSDNPSSTGNTSSRFSVSASRRGSHSSINSMEVKSQKRKLSNSRRIASQALHYVGAFFAAWTFPTIFQLVIVSTGKVHFWLLFFTAFFVPLQGMLNLIVFMRPKFLRYQRENPTMGYLKVWFLMMMMELGWITSAGEEGGNNGREGSGVGTSRTQRVKQSPNRSFFMSIRSSTASTSMVMKKLTSMRFNNAKENVMKDEGPNDDFVENEEINGDSLAVSGEEQFSDDEAAGPKEKYQLNTQSMRFSIVRHSFPKPEKNQRPPPLVPGVFEEDEDV